MAKGYEATIAKYKPSDVYLTNATQLHWVLASSYTLIHSCLILNRQESFCYKKISHWNGLVHWMSQIQNVITRERVEATTDSWLLE